MTQTLEAEVRAIARHLAALYESLATRADRVTFRSLLNSEIALARQRIRHAAEGTTIRFISSDAEEREPFAN